MIQRCGICTSQRFAVLSVHTVLIDRAQGHEYEMRRSCIGKMRKEIEKDSWYILSVISSSHMISSSHIPVFRIVLLSLLLNLTEFILKTPDNSTYLVFTSENKQGRVV
jgi:hypothetical protein